MSDIAKRIQEVKARLEEAWPLLGLEKKQEQLVELQTQMSKPDFWKDQERAKKISQQATNLEKNIQQWLDLREAVDVALTEKDVGQVEKIFEKLETQLLLSGKYDQHDAILTLTAGAGGTDAQDWAEMLLRMFLRFAEKSDWQAKIISISSGGEAGIKSCEIEISGDYVYGNLKCEAGVHRLVRISPFDAEKMRHTSFALAQVLPLLPETEAQEINDQDLKIDTFKAGGHGGQSVNTTDSAVRITHVPTGITVSCQNERSQMQNRETALKILQSKLQQYEDLQQEEERKKLKGEFTEAAWGNQIRSYVLHPYKMVKDHRTEFETQDVERVLDGDLQNFVDACLRKGV